MDKKIKRYLSYCLILLLLPEGSRAQTSHVIYTIQDCIIISLKNNISIRNSDLDVENARLNYRNSFGQKIPTLTLLGSQNLNAGYTIDPFTNQFVNQTIHSNNFSLNSSLTIFAGNQINRTHQRLRSIWQATKYSRDITKNQLILEIAQYYIGLLSAKQIENAARKRLLKVNQDRDKLLKKINLNSASKADLNDLDIQLASEQLNVSKATGEVNRQKLLLAQRMILPTLDFDIADPDVDKLLLSDVDTIIPSLYDSALSTLPNVKFARQNIVTSHLFELIQHGLYLPTISTTASIVTGYSSARTKVISLSPTGPIIRDDLYFRDTSGIVHQVSSSIFQNSAGSAYANIKYPFKERFADNINQGISLQANIPILNRLITKNAVENAKIQRLKAENELESLKQTVYNEIATAINEYTIAKANYLAAQTQLKRYENNLDASRARVEAGVLSSYDLLTYHTMLAISQSTYLQSKYELLLRKVVINFYQGKVINLL